MKKIFISIPWFSPAYKAGGPVQSIINMVNEVKDDISYRIYCADTDLNGEPLEEVMSDEWTVYNSYTEVMYSSENKRSDRLLKEVELYKPDILYITGLFSWHFNIVPLLFCNAPLKILSVRGMLHAGALSQKRLKKQFFLQALKLSGVHRKVLFHVTDSEEAEQVRKNFSTSVRIAIASNFPRIFKKDTQKEKHSGPLELVSIALISPMKNHLQILQALKNVTKNVNYNIYGPVKDAVYWQQCLEAIEHLPANVKVSYHGDVRPVQVPIILHKSDVFILPSKSENFGHAIIEALSAGVPVITSDATPWNRLREQFAGINDSASPASLTAAILFFAEMDKATYSKWTEGAASYAQKNTDFDWVKKAYAKMFDLSREPNQ